MRDLKHSYRMLSDIERTTRRRTRSWRNNKKRRFLFKKLDSILDNLGRRSP